MDGAVRGPGWARPRNSSNKTGWAQNERAATGRNVRPI